MNTFNFMGRLTANPELRISGENTLLYFTLAANRPNSTKEHPEADFIPFTAFGKTAENIAKFFTKGDMMAVTAHLSSSRVQRKDTPDVTETRISQIVDRWDFCQPKSAANNANTDKPAKAAQRNGSENDTSEELPF